MKISTKGRYALRVMINLARREKGSVSLAEIAKNEQISFKYLESIMGILVREKYVLSTRGAQGGYRLAKAADEYKVGDILRLVEGSLAPVACLKDPKNLCPNVDICSTVAFWQGLDNVIEQYVDTYTLYDLAKQ